VIERTNGILKMKFQKLLFLDVTNLSFIPNIIAAACVLHNFIEDAEGGIDEQAVEDELNQLRLHHAIDDDNEDEWNESDDKQEEVFVEAAIYRRRIANFLAGH